MAARETRTTTERGYGWAHQQARQQAIKDMPDGQPCSRCSQPMWRSEAHTLHYDHHDDRRGYRGLSHPKCNTRAGQAKAMQSRRTRTTTRRSNTFSRNW